MDRLYKKLEEYGKSDYYPFHMPGHKRNMDSSAASFPFDRDITEIHGFDNLHHAEGVIRDAQEYAAQIYGTQRCFFSVNGSTAALLAAISACVDKGGKILMARNCHKAVYHGLYIRDLHPIYIYPHEDSRLGTAHRRPEYGSDRDLCPSEYENECQMVRCAGRYQGYL